MLITPRLPSPSSQSKAGEHLLKENVKRADIRVRGGIIDEISEELQAEENDTVIEANNCWISPGFIDLQTHLRDFKHARTESIESGTRAAARGGFTTVVAMADSEPPIDSTQALSLLQRKIESSALVRVLPAACATMGRMGRQLTEMAQLSEMGAAAFTDADKSIASPTIMKRAMEYAALVGRPLFSYPEDETLASDGSMNECAQSTRLGLAGIPAIAESVCIAQQLELVRSTGCKLHFVQVSTKESIRLLRQAKAEALPITAAVSPHCLSMIDEQITTYDTNLKTNPPLRGKQDQIALLEAVKEGLIDAVSTNHSPHSRSEKMLTFSAAPAGIIGLETAFSLLFDRLVLAEEITTNELCGLLTIGPAKIMGLSEPAIKAGERADLVIIDPDKSHVYDAESGASRSSCSPFSGQTLRGKIIATIANGVIVYRSDS